MGKPSLQSDRARGSARLRRAAKPALAAILPVAVAFAIDSAFWPVPRTLLFNAAVIVSSWVGGLVSGLAATVMSAGIVWYQMQGQPATAPSAYRIYVTAGFFL